MSGELYEQVARLGDGTDGSSRAWAWIAWARLGFDIAASQRFAHSCLAVRELWPEHRPIPEALDQFRQGFADQRNGRRRPELRAHAADRTATVAAMVDHLRWITGKPACLPPAAPPALDLLQLRTDQMSRVGQRWVCQFCTRTSTVAYQWSDASGTMWWLDLCETHCRLLADAINLTNELYPEDRHHLVLEDTTVRLEACAPQVSRQVSPEVSPEESCGSTGADARSASGRLRRVRRP